MERRGIPSKLLIIPNDEKWNDEEGEGEYFFNDEECNDEELKNTHLHPTKSGTTRSVDEQLL